MKVFALLLGRSGTVSELQAVSTTLRGAAEAAGLEHAASETLLTTRELALDKYNALAIVETDLLGDPEAGVRAGGSRGKIAKHRQAHSQAQRDDPESIDYALRQLGDSVLLSGSLLNENEELRERLYRLQALDGAIS